MTDPVYGAHPLDPQQLWDETIRPAIADVDVVRWIGEVAAETFAVLLESDWQTRWRRSLITAEQAQLEARASELAFLCPDGWTDERCQAVLIAIYACAVANRTTARACAVAEALLDVGQTFEYADEFPCAGRFTFQNTSADDAQSYIVALDRARPPACQYFLVAHPGGGGTPFTIDTSQIDGPDTIGVMFVS